MRWRGRIGRSVKIIAKCRAECRFIAFRDTDFLGHGGPETAVSGVQQFRKRGDLRFEILRFALGLGERRPGFQFLRARLGVTSFGTAVSSSCASTPRGRVQGGLQAAASPPGGTVEISASRSRVTFSISAWIRVAGPSRRAARPRAPCAAPPSRILCPAPPRAPFPSARGPPRCRSAGARHRSRRPPPWLASSFASVSSRASTMRRPRSAWSRGRYRSWSGRSALQLGGAVFRAPFLAVQSLAGQNEPLQLARWPRSPAAQLGQLMRGDRLLLGGLGLHLGFLHDVAKIGF